MHKSLILLILFPTLFACHNPNEKNQPQLQTIIISKEYEANKNKDGYKEFATDYGTHHFIIDKDTNIFFYQREDRDIFCSVGITFDTLPELINLTPTDLVKVPQDAIRSILQANLKKENGNTIYVSSQIDTLKGIKINILLKAINDFRNKDLYLIRKSTQEEDTVLHYKKNENPFYPNQIKWDYSKISESKIKFQFVKPKQ